MTKKTRSKIPSPPPVAVEHPAVPAIALQTQLFPSGKIAFHSNTRVLLEFTPSTVVVHNPDAPPSGIFKLGPILYTYQFEGAAEKKLKLSPSTVMVDGRASAKQQFLLLRILRNGHAECGCCGKVWEAPGEPETIPHMKAHLDELEFTLTQPHMLINTWMLKLTQGRKAK